MRKPIARLFIAFAVAAVVAATFGGCSADQPGSADGTLRVGMVFDVGGKGDKSFNDSAYRGLLHAADQFGVEHTEFEPGQDADRETGLRKLAQARYDVIIGVGFLFSDAMRNLVSAVMFVPQSDSILKAWIVEDMASGPPDVGMGALRNTLLWPTTTRSEALAALRVPVRLINSPLYPTDSAAVNRYGMDVVIMPGVGHFAMMEDPATFNALLSTAIADFAN